MVEHKALHDFVSWREEWCAADVERLLAIGGLKGWTFDHWSDGDMQFMHKGPVSFDDLAILRVAFKPIHMDVAAVVDSDAADAQELERELNGKAPPDRESTPLMVLVSMSWYATPIEREGAD